MDFDEILLQPHPAAGSSAIIVFVISLKKLPLSFLVQKFGCFYGIVFMGIFNKQKTTYRIERYSVSFSLILRELLIVAITARI